MLLGSMGTTMTLNLHRAVAMIAIEGDRRRVVMVVRSLELQILVEHGVVVLEGGKVVEAGLRGEGMMS